MIIHVSTKSACDYKQYFRIFSLLFDLSYEKQPSLIYKVLKTNGGLLSSLEKWNDCTLLTDINISLCIFIFKLSKFYTYEFEMTWLQIKVHVFS